MMIHLNFASIASFANRLVLLAATPKEFQQVVDIVTSIEGGVFAIASALATLMVVVAGTMIMLDREATEKRGQRLQFLTTVVIGYAIVLGAHILISLAKNLIPAQ